jgi:hypothetical protein
MAGKAGTNAANTAKSRGYESKDQKEISYSQAIGRPGNITGFFFNNQQTTRYRYSLSLRVEYYKTGFQFFIQPIDMFNKSSLIMISLMLLFSTGSIAQKILSEGIIYYDISVQTGSSEPQMADMFDGAKAAIFLRGSMSRSELTSSLGSTTTIYDHRAGNGVVLRDFGTQKLLIKMNKENWADKNKLNLNKLLKQK